MVEVYIISKSGHFMQLTYLLATSRPVPQKRKEHFFLITYQITCF